MSRRSFYENPLVCFHLEKNVPPPHSYSSLPRVVLTVTNSPPPAAKPPPIAFPPRLPSPRRRIRLIRCLITASPPSYPAVHPCLGPKTLFLTSQRAPPRAPPPPTHIHGAVERILGGYATSRAPLPHTARSSESLGRRLQPAVLVDAEIEHGGAVGDPSVSCSF
jgi:hypothetical protein